VSDAPPSCTYVEAARNHLLDSRRASVEQRWQWLCEAMDLGVANARRRAQRGQITLDAHRRVWWSPELERQHFPAEAGATDFSAPESAAPSPT
jgi:hypothetical protein